MHRRCPESLHRRRLGPARPPRWTVVRRLPPEPVHVPPPNTRSRPGPGQRRALLPGPGRRKEPAPSATPSGPGRRGGLRRRGPDALLPDRSEAARAHRTAPRQRGKTKGAVRAVRHRHRQCRGRWCIPSPSSGRCQVDWLSARTRCRRPRSVVPRPRRPSVGPGRGRCATRRPRLDRGAHPRGWALCPSLGRSRGAGHHPRSRHVRPRWGSPGRWSSTAPRARSPRLAERGERPAFSEVPLPEGISARCSRSTRPAWVFHRPRPASPGAAARGKPSR
jgi:hypothetical protein